MYAKTHKKVGLFALRSGPLKAWLRRNATYAISIEHQE